MEIIRTRDKGENGKIREKYKSWFFEKMNKINRLSAKPPEDIKGFKLLKGEITRD